MRFLRRSLTGLFLLALTAGLLGLAARTVSDAVQARLAGPDRPPVARERVFTVNVVLPQAQSVAPVLATYGEVRSRRTLDLRAPSGGRVVELAPAMEDGAAVAEGQLLLRIDPADARAARDLAASDLARAEADLRDAARTLALARDELAAAESQARLRAQALDRQRSLVSRGVGSEAAAETAELALAQAEQSVLSRRQALAQAESRVEQSDALLARQRITLGEAERRLAATEVYAGFDGTLSDVTVVLGGIVTANERLARIIDPAALEVAFRLSTSQYARLLDASGALIPAEVEVALDVLGLEIVARGTLTRVSGTVGEGQTGRLVYAAIDSARGFRPGDFVAVRVAEPVLRDVALLPATAVDSADTILVVGDGERLEQRPVTVLRRQGDSVIVRAEGVAGAAVVAERAPMLGAGILVRPVRPAAAVAAAAAGAEAAAMITLDPERRARLVSFVEGNGRLPAEVKERILSQLRQEAVPAQVVARIEAQMGS
ncbi:MAG: HlyD family efflux transporter periplasmic adaptor subunit [Rhodobacteraceae bacterium]|jgi:multidrug resistance efflux pump|nr:HlyD family efflux transporter periplasmic adaptor subunit [Paracoccaceae bacterium]